MRRLRIAGLITIILGVALRVALPFLITKVLEDQVAQNSPFVLEIGDLDLDLIAGRARAEQASLRAATTTGDEGPRLLLGGLDLELDPWALFEGRLHVRRVTLRDVALRAAQSESGAIDWVALLEEAAADAPPPAEEASSEPLSLVLDHAALSPLGIELHHAPSGRVFHQTIDATLDDFRLNAAPADSVAAPESKDDSFGFEVRSRGDLGDLTITGRASQTLLDVRAKILAQALDLLGLSTLLNDPSLDLAGGSLALDLDVHAAAGAAAAGEPAPLVVTATGSIAAASPRLALPVSGIALSLAGLDVQLGSLRVESRRDATAVDLAVKLGADTIDTDLGEGATVGIESFAAELEVGLKTGAGLELALAGPIETRGTRLAFPAAGVREAVFETLSLRIDQLDLVNANEKLQLESRGRLDAAGHSSKLTVEVGDGLRAETFRFDSLVVPIDGFGMAGPVVQLGQVAVVGPSIELRRIAATGAASARAEADGQAGAGVEASTSLRAGAEGEVSAPALRFELAGFELRGGRMRVDDETLQPAHAVKLDGIAVDLRRFRVGGEGGAGPELEDGELRIASLGTQPLVAKVSMQGRRMKATLKGEQIDLAAFTAYAEQAGGYAITGSVSADVDAAIDGDSIEAPIDLVFQDLTLRSQQEDAPLAQLFREIGVSLDMALALLRDPRGRISLEIPVVSSGAGTTVRLAPILRDGLLQALTGALASPLKLAGATLAAVRGDEDPTLASVSFAPGESAVTAEAKDEMAGVARLLASRPGLQVVLRARATRADHEALAVRLGAPLAEGGEGVEAPLSAELRAALAALQRERLEAARVSLVEHAELSVGALQVLEEDVPVPESAPLEAGAAALDIRIGGTATAIR